ncbi:unnamed protein product [Taenia asiatica]|uniref:Zinc finger protein 474 n=1 Tax=Taenia asiatica TaxID=60517 RepID=A0A0R3WFA5_TAEAS|nr:unnamed protein product [Taenia asiatica]
MTSMLKGVNLTFDLIPKCQDIRPREIRINRNYVSMIKPQPKPRANRRKKSRRCSSSAPPLLRNTEAVNSNYHNPADGRSPQGDRRGVGKPISTNITNVECPSCQRIYTRRSLDFHLKVCAIRQAEEEKRRNAIESAIEKQNRGPSRPPGKLCYICGRRYTKSSWAWHEPKCQEQWNTWHSRLPKALQHRGGLLKPNTDDETLEAIVEQEKAAGNPNFNKKDALEKVLFEVSRANALPV